VAESSWPLPPNAVVSDTMYEQLLQGYVPSGVMGSPGDTTIITAPGSGTRIITVRLGKYALVRGHMWYSGTSDVNLSSLAANASGNPRIDLVVLRYTRSTGAVAVAVVTGTPAASPTAPAPTQTLTTSGVFEVPIAQVAVASGATTITTGNITTRESYLSRTPLLGAALPTAAGTPGVYLGQRFDWYDSGSASLRRLWWDGSAWSASMNTQYVGETTTTSGDITVGAGSNTVLISNTFTAVSGVRYRLHFETTYKFATGNGVVLTARHATGSSVTTGSTGVGARELMPVNTTWHTPVAFSRTVVASAAGTYTVGVSANFYSGSGNLFWAANSNSEMYLRVEYA
jgi:hypothetical protein